ncbi:50S ribosomal protein L25 [Candidatus Kaiserbacteria bacterium]|nr:50S ribosomal protein L25 [Candidatus Kaiserbacteria bacterium]
MKLKRWCSVIEFIEIVDKARIILRIKKQIASVYAPINHVIQFHPTSITNVGRTTSYMGRNRGDSQPEKRWSDEIAFKAPFRYSVLTMLTLSVEKRDAGAGVPALRRSGRIPAVVYGANQASTPLAVEARAFENILREAGEATIVSLTGLGAPLPTLIHKVDLDPLTSVPRHVDFYAVTKGKKVEVAIPLDFEGVSPAVEAGANLVKVLHEIEVEADPMNLPHDIKVDLSLLAAIGGRIHAKDLALPAGVELAIDPEEVVALVQEVVEEKEEVAPAYIASIEVEKKGKEEVEGEALAGSAV